MFNELILDRLEYDDGTFVGDNRITEDGNYYYEQLLKSGDWLLGYGDKIKGDVKGSGFKLYVLNNGFVGVICWVLVLLLLAFQSKNRGFAIGFFIISFLALYQRFYPYWFCWFFTYIAAIMSEYPKCMQNENKL